MTAAARSCPACHTPLPDTAQFCMACGTATPTDPGVPPRTATTGVIEVDKVTRALAGRYRIERVVGEGGMATVYLAEDQKHKRKVAVKVMRPELAATLGADRFLREIEIAAGLTHPHILPMHDSGESDGLLYYVMPYVEGETLRERLAREGTVPPDQALRLAREIAEALAFAHSRGFIHRDIKPANILLQANHALVADFGIARAVEDVGGESLTRTGLAVGTPQYMAPEQASGEKDVDGRADVYATGAILYEMLAGQPPFTGPNPRAILTRSLTEAAKAPSTVRAAVPPTVDAVVLKALARNPEDRYATAEAFAEAIDGLRQSTPTPSGFVPAIPAPPATVAMPAAGKGRPAWLSPRNGAIAVAVLAALTFVVVRGRTGAGAPTGTATLTGSRLAVLPFRNDAGASDAYLVDGVAGESRRLLAQLGSLTVIGSTSSGEYRDTKKPATEIGRELGADVLLRATAHWEGSGADRRLVIEPELVDARTGKTAWRQSIDEGEAQLMALPGAVAVAVAEALGTRASPAELAAFRVLPTKSAEAYRAALRGRAESGNDPATLRASIQEFEQAVALDSTFGDAWGALANSSALLYLQGNRDPKIAARARQALDRVLALKPGTPMARRAKANVLEVVIGDEPAARQELDLALREWPNDPGLLALSGTQDMGVGDLGSALTKLERARELDPRAPIVLLNLMQAYTYLNRPEDAQRVAATTLAVLPTSLNAIQFSAIAYLAAADLPGARRILREAIQRGVPAPRVVTQMTGYQETGFALEEPEQQLVLRLTPATYDDDRAWWAQSLATLYWQRGDTAMARAYADSAIAPTQAQITGAPQDPQLRALLALMYAYLGRSAEARASLAQSMEHVNRFSQQTYNRVNAAKTELALGNKDAAIEHLRTVRRMGYYLTNGWLAVDPTFASLKGYPPFEQMLKEK